MTPQRILANVRLKLIEQDPFFGFLALSLELQETHDPTVKTLATDGKRLYYNPDFVRSAFTSASTHSPFHACLIHQVLHCALGHLWRRGGRDKDRWDIATDHVVNLMVKASGYTVPADWYCDAKYEGLSAEEVYMKLAAEEQEGQKTKKNLADSHDKWQKQVAAGVGQNGEDGADKNGAKEDASSAGSGMQDREGDNTNDEDAQSAGEGQSSSRSGPHVGTAEGECEDGRVLAADWQERVSQAAHAARGQGNLPSALAHLVEDTLYPKIDWKQRLRNLIWSVLPNDFRITPSAKKYLWQELYLPSVKGDEIEIDIGIDSSGSVSTSQFQEFIAEVRGITDQFEAYRIRIFICDVAVHHELELTTQDDWPEKFPKASGGTNFRPVFERIRKSGRNASALIYLTDGQGTYPAGPPEYPVFWVLNQDYNVPWGEKIVMEGAHSSRKG